MILEKKKRVIEEYIRAYNSFDTDAMTSLFHPECRFENIVGGHTTVSANGIAELRELMEQGKNIFSSRKQTITEIYSENEVVVAAKIKYEGKLKVDLPNNLKAGDELILQGRSEFEFKDGLIKSLKDYS